MNPPVVADFTAPPPKPTAPNRPMLPCPFSAHGMQQPSSRQPPPMYGPRGATIPPQHLNPWTGGGGGGGSGAEQSRPDNGRIASGGRGRGRGFQPRGGGGNQRPRHQPQQPRFGGQPIQSPVVPLPPRLHAKPQPDQQHQHPASDPQLLRPSSTTSRQFWCEPCDRDFGDASELQAHRGDHQRCSVDGCHFEAHAQLVVRHVQQQHTSGLYDRLKNLTTPEEIARWREERRRRFPSKQNVELRQQIQEAKQKRGERLEAESSARFGQRADRRLPAPAKCGDAERKQQKQPAVRGEKQGPMATGNDRDAATGKNRKRRNRKRGAGNRDAAAGAADGLDGAAKAGAETEMNGGVAMFRGTSTMKNYRKPHERVANALSGLLGAYGSDDEEQVDDTEDEVEEEEQEAEESVEEIAQTIPAKPDPCDVEMAADDKETEKPVEIQPSTPETATGIDDCEEPNVQLHEDHEDGEAPVEESIQRASDQPEEPAEATSKPLPVGGQKRTRPSATKVTYENAESAAKCPKRGAIVTQAHPTSTLDLSRRYRNQNTMLEKLLQRDIRHERNVLLQCVRYVVENEFFGVGQVKK